MSELITQQVTVKLDDIAHLFVAPEFDPFSDQEAELLGQPALVYLLRQLGPDVLHQRHPIHLTVQLPPDKVTPDLKARAGQALRRFCAARIADHEAQLRAALERFAFAAFGDRRAGHLSGAVRVVFEQHLYFLVEPHQSVVGAGVWHH